MSNYPDGTSELDPYFGAQADREFTEALEKCAGVKCDNCGYEEFDINGNLNHYAGDVCPDCQEYHLTDMSDSELEREVERYFEE